MCLSTGGGGGGIPAYPAGGIPACLAAGLGGYPSIPCMGVPGPGGGLVWGVLCLVIDIFIQARVWTGLRQGFGRILAKGWARILAMVQPTVQVEFVQGFSQGFKQVFRQRLDKSSGKGPGKGTGYHHLSHS